MTPPNSDAILKIAARQVFDSRGWPTVEVDVTLRDGSVGRASVPSGASTGHHEAVELRDGDSLFYEGRGVQHAVDNVRRQISHAIVGMSSCEQLKLDRYLIELDGSSDLSRLGANAILATSLAVCRAAATHLHLPLYRYIGSLCHHSKFTLPMPMTNILSGGAHASGGMDFQDFLVIPAAAKSFSEGMHLISRVRRSAQLLMMQRGMSTLLADEGGLSPRIKTADAALHLLAEAIESAGLTPGQDVAIALDVAATSFFNAGAYELRCEELRLSGDEMIAMITDLVRKYAIISVEDGLGENDWDHWAKLMMIMPHLQIVGDDLFATNSGRIRQGINRKAASAVLVKLNQNGTLSGTLDAIELARRAGFATIVSSRSGETEDHFIADLAVGTSAGQIKIGSVRSSERLSKYNQLLRIEEDAGVSFVGMSGIAGYHGQPPSGKTLDDVSAGEKR